MELGFWTQSISDVAKALDAHISTGLQQAEAQKRLQEHGPNTLPKKGKIIWWKLLLEQFASFIVWLLIGAAVVAGLLGEVIDFFAILAIVVLNAVLGFFQEFRAESALEALQKLAAPTCKVVRDGRLQTLPAEQIVPGDLVLLEAGDTIPADGRIIDLSYMAVDEASLTGESVSVTKQTDPLEGGDQGIGEQTNMVFMGTTVVRGKGHALITKTGLDTEMGKIASQLMGEKKEQTPLQNQLNHLGKRLVYICLAVVALVFLLGLLRGNSAIEMLLISLSLAVAAIPEGLPAVVTISLSIGVRKMAEKKALVRRLSSVETLGCTSVICTDKTGTLTQNSMTVRSVYVDEKSIEVSGSGYKPEGEFSQESQGLDTALQIGVLCNSANILQEEGNWVVAGDPTEGALLTAAAKKGFWKKELEEKSRLISEIPFDSERKMMSVLREENGRNKLYVKGAPDVLQNKANKWLVNGKEEPINREAIALANEELASKAFRVLAVAYQTNMEASLEQDLVFVGLMAMQDPPRPEVKEAIESCKSAGIETIMVTGDHINTAVAIASEIGIETKGAVDGNELETLTEEEIRQVNVFSRISADHKLRIINALKEEGKVTAMTGDGVNDAPAVQAADIGIAMGITGTDVTKGCSDMIILDDNFASIVKAVEQGRGIYDNIVKFVSYLLSSNIAEILVIFLVMLFGTTTETGAAFIPLLPVQLLWMNLVTDGFPAISLAMDPVDPRAMSRPPRPRAEQILNRRFALFVFSISVLVTLGALTACYIGLRTSSALAQTMTFTTLIVLELVRVQMIRKQYKMKLFSNPYLIIALASSFILQLAVLYIPQLQIVFGTVPLALTEWAVILGIGAALWWLGQGLTKIFYKE
ncbi:MAG: cation-translocating P-type ATPase [Simkaniaceae bacterium]|nr:cation-translocating P-type ATPase [Candidatus Sacchlamyda saccharinae]